MPHHPLYRIGQTRKSVQPNTKRTIKYLASCSDPRIQRLILNSAHDSVYKSICNAFFNVAENPEIKISPKKKNIFKAYNSRIRKLISPKIPIRQKKTLIQKGGAFFLSTIIPLVLKGALSILGSTFLSKLKSGK